MVKTNVVRLLTAAGLPFKVLEYSVADGRVDAMSIAEKTGEEPDQTFKTLVTETPKKEYFVFVIPAPATLDLKKAAAAAGVKNLDMIPQKTLFPLTGYVHGGCSPIGRKRSFPTFIDETAILFDHINFSGGHLGVMISMEPETACKFIGAEFTDLTR
ncbi:MAG: aminoacyl-tRNA deacylase [Lentisphaeria bacterium]|nr:aminoacyl-tRNA deacylase [Lentisphaeria bacterium]